MQNVAGKNKTLELLGFKRLIVDSVFCQNTAYQVMRKHPKILNSMI